MSFSFQFVAIGKEKAIAHMKTLQARNDNIPQSVADFIVKAIETVTEDQGFAVTANGHLCMKPGDYAPSNCTITVQPLGKLVE